MIETAHATWDAGRQTLFCGPIALKYHGILLGAAGGVGE